MISGLPRASVVPDASRQHVHTVGDACAGEISRPLRAGSGHGKEGAPLPPTPGRIPPDDSPDLRGTDVVTCVQALAGFGSHEPQLPPSVSLRLGPVRTDATTEPPERQPVNGEDRHRVRLLLAAAALGLGLTIPPASAAAASLPVCHVYEDGSGLCTFGGGTQKAYGNDPKTDAPCFISKQKATTGRPAISDATSYWPNRDLRLYLTRGSEPYLCIVVTS